ncbi:MAG: beta-N-acetylhexosaminidase [Proteobacteria bacterium]|nr:beta-N-acetylhexosaminidase [Pseudomonadota bacterium]
MALFIVVSLLWHVAVGAPDLIDEQSIKLEEANLNKKVENVLSSLTLEQKIGQMLLYGFKGQTAEEDAAPLIKKYNLGGVILFTRNINSENQTVKLDEDIQHYAINHLKIPVFISIDQEGGKVLRIQNFGTVLPGNMNLGATRSPTLSFLAGKLTSVDLEMLGINMNLAPVLDVNTSAKNEVIGVRSFGSDPDMVAVLGSSYIRGIQSRKVSATAKHFPGHGNTSGDSHFEIMSINRTLDELKRYDLKPFYEAIKNGVDAIMTAHISVPSIDPSGLPATLSNKIITGLLRNEMGYNGLIITDDMEMRPVTKDWPIGKSATQAILAGCDMVIVVWTDSAKEEVYNSILSAVKNNLITQSRIDESVRRILRVKFKRQLFDNTPDPNIAQIKRVVGNKFHQQISHLIAQKSITIVKNMKHIIPLVNKKEQFIVLSPFSYLSKELNDSGLNNNLIKMDVKLDKSQRDRIINEALSYQYKTDAYIVAVIDDSQAQIAKALKQKSRIPVIVASLDSPYIYSTVKDADAYLCAYSFRTQALRALARVITGQATADGILPVYIEKTPAL